MSNRSYSTDELTQLTKNYATFVGIDSDGCVFDSMEIKQRGYFHPVIIQAWNLSGVEKEFRECADFTSMFSQWRGLNRFQILLKCFQLLCARPEVQQSGVSLPCTASLKAFVESGLPLDNAHLSKEISRTGDTELQRILDWSLEVNHQLEQFLDPIPPFQAAVSCIQKMHGQSDLIAVSQTPEEIVSREWGRCDLTRYIQTVAGPELGSKTNHLSLARGERWESSHMLMIGDAPGDQKAAHEVGCWFYPILPGQEERSWDRLHHQVYDLFLRGGFTQALQDELNREFNQKLPLTASWETE